MHKSNIQGFKKKKNHQQYANIIFFLSMSLKKKNHFQNTARFLSRNLNLLTNFILRIRIHFFHRYLQCYVFNNGIFLHLSIFYTSVQCTFVQSSSCNYVKWLLYRKTDINLHKLRIRVPIRNVEI